MKTMLRISVFAFLCFAVVSCKKSSLADIAGPAPVNTEPFIYSKIEKNILQPSAMELGTSAAVIHQGDSVTIFVPYSAVNETFVKATVTMTDDATGSTINSYDLVPYTDPTAFELNVPESMSGHPEFFFVRFVADEGYTGKTVSLSTRLEGQITQSADVLNSAFSVQP